LDKEYSYVTHLSDYRKESDYGQPCIPLQYQDQTEILPNLQVKRFYIPEDDRWVTLKVSTSGIRSINKVGIVAALKEARAKGLYTD
jgi:hypothetical protein